MGWKRRSIIATAAGTIVGATNDMGVPSLFGADSTDPVEPELEIVEELTETFELQPCASTEYELDSAVEYLEWDVEMAELGQLVNVNVMDARSYSQFLQGDDRSTVHDLSEWEVYADSASGWLRGGPYVVYVENAVQEVVKGTLSIVGKQRVDTATELADNPGDEPDGYHMQPGATPQPPAGCN